jgi:hypothetical protein
MDCDQLASAFHRITESIRTGSDPGICWSQILRTTAQDGNHSLMNLSILKDVGSIQSQLIRILRTEPMPPGVDSLFFGLFDEIISGSESAGFYVSGYSGDGFDGCVTPSTEPAYFPNRRFLDSQVLKAIKAEGKRHSNHPGERDVIDYAVMFGGAAILAKFSCIQLGFKLPIYVGFDSGDLARIAN